MGSTFSGIELGKRSIMAHTTAITTAGHNISNANTEGYSRQRVAFKEFDPLYLPELERPEEPGMIGQGVSAFSIRRIRDELLDRRIVEQANQEAYWDTRSKYYTMLEQIYNEPDDVSIRSTMDKFWEAWQELSIHPENIASRQAIVTRGISLTDTINQRYESLQGVNTLINGDIDATVKQINNYAEQIAALNGEIVRSRGMGDNPNDLLDQRDLLVDKLSELVNCTASDRDKDEFMVHVDGRVLVQGGIPRSFDLRTVIDNNGNPRLIWGDTKNDAVVKGGRLGALIELRDVDIRSEMQSLNTMTMNFSDLVNDVHRNATGMNGTTGLDFFTSHPFVENVRGNYDYDADGVMDRSYIFRFTGRHKLNSQEQIGLAGTMTFSAPDGRVEVAYNATDTVADVIDRINDSNGEVKAYLDRNNNLVLKATTALSQSNPDFVIRHVEDSGMFLTGYAGILRESGEEGAYDYLRADAADGLADGAQFAVTPQVNPSAYIAVNPLIRGDVKSVAAGFADTRGALASGDGRAAIEIASIRNTQVMIGHKRTFDDYFADSVTNVGLKGEQAATQTANQNKIMGDLRTLRESVSGVNIDEELADIIKFQHGYNAAASFISTWDNLVDTIINRIRA